MSLATFDGRSVLYQASLSEMWVPYMDPAYGWFYKNYFDAGEYGFGLFATPLTPAWIAPVMRPSTTTPWVWMTLNLSRFHRPCASLNGQR